MVLTFHGLHICQYWWCSLYLMAVPYFNQPPCPVDLICIKVGLYGFASLLELHCPIPMDLFLDCLLQGSKFILQCESFQCQVALVYEQPGIHCNPGISWWVSGWLQAVV